MKNFAPFPSPHVHIQSLDSASTPAAFAKRELELGTGVLTVTDHGTLIACHTVYELAKKHRLIAIPGYEGYMRDDACPLFEAAGVAKDKAGTYSDHFKYGHFTAHCLDQKAFQVLTRLVSDAPLEQHGSEAKPLFNWRAMEELGAANTTVTSGCLIGVVARHLLKNNDPAMARRYYERLRAMVRPGHFFVELFPNICTHNYVKGVFLVTQKRDSDGKDIGDPSTLKFWPGKVVKTDAAEIKVAALAAAFSKKDNPHHRLVAVKNYGAWVDVEAAPYLLEVNHKDDFVENECQDWCPDGDVQLGVNKFMLELANSHKDPVLISDDAHHATVDEKIIQTVRLAQSGWGPFYGSYHRKTSAEAWEYFHNRMGVDEKTFEGWIANGQEWAQRFKGFKFETKPELPTKFYEPLYAQAKRQDSLGYTLHLIEQHGRMDWKNPVWVDRLRQEIDLLHKNGIIDLLPYFMLDEEVCRLYRDRDLLTGPGRGSAAGLLLAYLLGITHVDPIRYGLSLDRFITLDRIKSGRLPDIDQDLGTREPLVGADENSGWLRERFGDHVAQISTVMSLKLRSAVLDVARFKLGAVPRDVAELAHKFVMPPQGVDDLKHVLGYEDSGNEIPGSIETDPALQAYVASYPEQWEIVKKCLGLGRGASRHACGFLVAGRPIKEFIPLTKIGGVTCTQFTAAAVEAMGGLKMDFLIVNSLNDIQAALEMIQVRTSVPVPREGLRLHGKWVPAFRLVPIPGATRLWVDHEAVGAPSGISPESLFADVWDLPEDQDVFAAIACGRTETVFQLNTPGAVQWLRYFGHKRADGKYAIASIEDMAAFTALDRPGPLDAPVSNPDEPGEKHNMLVEYARRARGAKPSPDIPPIFDKLLPKTYGIMVFQESLQKMYQEIVGCAGAEAEEFRSNVAKKKKEKVIAAYPRFVLAATEKFGSREVADKIWNSFNTFGAYGFNKSVLIDTILEDVHGNQKKIVDFKVGDSVKCVDETGQVVGTEVVAVHDHGELEGFEVEFDDGYKITCSINHKFLTEYGMKPLYEILDKELEILAAP